MAKIPTDELNALVYNLAILNSEAAYRKIFAFLYNSLYRFSFSMLKSKQLAEEVASDVMLKLWQKRVELLQIENVQVYALVIARNLSLNLLKKSQTGRVVSLNLNEQYNTNVSPKVINPEQLLINAQNKAKLNSSIDALPTRCKLVFKLIKEEGLNYKEVAEVLNISPKTVDAHLVTAMKKLSEALAANFSRT